MADEFAAMVRNRTAVDWEDWLQRAESVASRRGFADGIRRDEAAVRAGLSQPWSNGPVEGPVGRLKFPKRQMYGRAGFDLVKARVRNAAEEQNPNRSRRPWRWRMGSSSPVRKSHFDSAVSTPVETARSKEDRRIEGDIREDLGDNPGRPEEYPAARSISRLTVSLPEVDCGPWVDPPIARYGLVLAPAIGPPSGDIRRQRPHTRISLRLARPTPLVHRVPSSTAQRRASEPSDRRPAGA